MDKKQLSLIKRTLCKNDSIMSGIINVVGTLTISTSRQSHFSALVRAIVDQQLSVKAGHTIQKRLLQLQGGYYFKVENILACTEKQMRECGLSGKKVSYIRTLAQAIVEGDLNFRKLVKKTNDEVAKELLYFPGIGQWTVDMFLMNSLKRLDVFPVGDLVIRKMIRHYYNLSEESKFIHYEAVAQAWAPYRSIASFYLWRSNSL
ncbi:DNA-3-methyladenine glycosylase II [hydrothermal vent metagenome]|uniref:DNA-3-methyladenine glycosylase II n=1 Tax=hydrothermal vent metagenome TaxID=652676 RepID=A0A3B0YC81_9ZZZZ